MTWKSERAIPEVKRLSNIWQITDKIQPKHLKLHITASCIPTMTKNLKPCWIPQANIYLKGIPAFQEYAITPVWMLGHIHRSSSPRHQSKHALITHRDVSSELSTSGSKAGTIQDSFREPEHTSGGHRAVLIAMTRARPWGICPGKSAKAVSELSKSQLPSPIGIVGPQSSSYTEECSTSFLLERSNLFPWRKKGGISMHNFLQVLLFIDCTRKTHAKFSSLKQWASNCGTQHLLPLTSPHPYQLSC